jgi:hypothetical protein
LGLTFGLDGVNAYQNQALGLRVLRAALEQGGHAQAVLQKWGRISKCTGHKKVKFSWMPLSNKDNGQVINKIR